MSQKKYHQEDWLKSQYIDKGKSSVEIAEDVGVTAGTITHWLEKLEVNTRSVSEALEGRELSKESKNKISDSVSEYLEENSHPFEGKSHTDESRQKMSNAKKGDNNHFHEESRPEHSERMSGKNNPSWKGGKTESMDFRKKPEWQKFSQEVKDSLGWICANCEKKGGDGANLHLHHMIPVSEGGCKYKNKFVVLCKECHRGKHKFWHSSSVKEQRKRLERDELMKDYTETEVM